MSEEKIKTLQNYEYNLQQLLMQKQQIHSNLAEIDNALKELENTNEAYQIIGGILVKKSPGNISSSLNEKKELLDIRLKAIDKQEKTLNEKASALQKEVMEEMKENDSKR